MGNKQSPQTIGKMVDEIVTPAMQEAFKHFDVGRASELMQSLEGALRANNMSHTDFINSLLLLAKDPEAAIQKLKPFAPALIQWATNDKSSLTQSKLRSANPSALLNAFRTFLQNPAPTEQATQQLKATVGLAKAPSPSPSPSPSPASPPATAPSAASTPFIT